MMKFMQGEWSISFQHLYDENYGCFAIDYYGNKYIIMPSDKTFKPEKNKKYKVDIRETSMGRFKYNNINYRLAIATLIDSGNIIDVIDYKHLKQEPKKQKTAMELAFEKAKNNQ